MFSERFELPRKTSILQKAIGWCTAQWKMLLFCVKNIVKELCKFELARLKKNKKKKKKETHFGCLGDFLVRYFRDAF